MYKKYNITGMTCESCVSKVKSALLKVSGVTSAEVQLEAPQAKVEFSKELSDAQLHSIIREAGNYAIETVAVQSKEQTDLPKSSITTYKPLIFIVTFIAGVTFLAQYPFEDFSLMLWMRHFMAGFFIVFAFFKLLNLKGFANSYSMYDLLAAKWKEWGYIYPFVELTLGVLYLIDLAPVVTNTVTIIVLGFSSLGVIQSVLNKQKIKCACLGDVFNLPMSTVTIVEDLSMVGMAVIMIIVQIM